MTYDSTSETKTHIGMVTRFLDQIVDEIDQRILEHDQSKLCSPEKELFDEWSPRLREMEYGSDEYRESLEALGPALAHHYATYRHHPEHFENGVHDMNLVDLIEMLADWKAATLRMDNGDLGKSIVLNAKRFGYGDEMLCLLQTTARDFGWL